MRDMILPLVIWNTLNFLLMGIDKYQSTRGHWRIRESILLAGAFAMGGFGSLTGSLLFHHKTRKMKFRILLPAAVLCNLAGICLFIQYFGK